VAHESFPNDAHNNREVTLPEHEQIVAPLGLSGMINYSSTEPLFGDSTGMQVKLRAGVRASVRGTRFNNTSETTVSIAGNTSGNTRIDLIVLRLRRQESGVGVGDQFTVIPHRIAGTPAAIPVAPSPVRDDTLDGTGFWDIPLAEVTVIHNATTITAAQVVSRAYYIAGSGYTGRDSWGKPPVEPGVIFRANDTGVAYIGTASGTWQRIYYDTGWVPVTGGPNAAGWTFANFAVRRQGNLILCNMFLVRTGGTVGASSHQKFGPTPAEFRADRTIYGTWISRHARFASYFAPDLNTGEIHMVMDGVHTIPTNDQIVGSMTWAASS
jgi:hypothetical protein